MANPGRTLRRAQARAARHELSDPLTELQRIVAKYSPQPGVTYTGTELKQMQQRLYASYPAAVANVRHSAGMTPVPIRGSVAKGREAGYFMARTIDGAPAYFMRRTDDCMQAAIATVLGIPPHEIPIPPINGLIHAGRDPEEVDQMVDAWVDEWAARCGVRIVMHPTASITHPPTRSKWIGIAQHTLTDHCLVLHGSTVIHDPLAVLPGTDLDQIADLADNIEFGLTIERN